MGLCSIVFLLLLTLKLTGLALISWTIVFLPLIIIATIWVIILFLGFLAYKRNS